MVEKNDFQDFLLNLSTNIFLELDKDGHIFYASSKAKQVLDTADLVGASILPLLDATSRDLLISRLKTVIFNGQADSFNLEFKQRYYNVFIYPYQDKGVVCLEDITERRQLSQALNKTKRRLEFAEQTARLGYWELNLTAKRFYWSAEMFRIFGLDAKMISHKTNIIREHILADDLPLYKEKIAHLLRDSRPVEGRVRIIRDNGELAYCLFKASIIFDVDGERIAGTFQDITPLAETEVALNAAKNEADRLNLAKSYFLAQASHDLRQPMQALNMFISTLGQEDLTSPQHYLVAKITASADNLKSLLDNLLDISKLDSDGMSYTPKKINLSRFLGHLCNEFVDVAEHHKLKFKYRSPLIMLETDAFLLERILRNLLSNAFKYARSRVFLVARNANDGVRITVYDDGLGISPQEQKLIFHEFYQSTDIANNRSLGAGLGLSIAQKITHILSGSLNVSSIPSQGSAFCLWLPKVTTVS